MVMMAYHIHNAYGPLHAFICGHIPALHRFRSTQVLVCTCGTAGCRGTVNCPDEDVFLDDAELVPRAEVKHVSLHHAHMHLEQGDW